MPRLTSAKVKTITKTGQVQPRTLPSPSRWGRTSGRGRETVAQFGEGFAQQFPFLGGHAAKGPAVVCNLCDCIRHGRNEVFDQSKFNTPPSWAEVGEAVSQIVQPTERSSLSGCDLEGSAAAGFDAFRFRPESLEQHRGAGGAVTRRLVERAPGPPNGYAEFVDTIVDRPDPEAHPQDGHRFGTVLHEQGNATVPRLPGEFDGQHRSVDISVADHRKTARAPDQRAPPKTHDYSVLRRCAAPPVQRPRRGRLPSGRSAFRKSA